MSRTLVIAAIAAVAMPGASAHGSGAWLDTHHTKEGKDHAGVRYISESPPHVLTMVGSDDGATWWTLKGWCDGDGMTNIHFDFSPKGGPKDIAGKWIHHEDGTLVICWSDGNCWKSIGDLPADAKFGAVTKYKENKDQNVPNPLTAERCSIRYSTLLAAQDACTTTPECVAVVKDNGIACGAETPMEKKFGEKLLYELRSGNMYSNAGTTAWLK